MSLRAPITILGILGIVTLAGACHRESTGAATPSAETEAPDAPQSHEYATAAGQPSADHGSEGLGDPVPLCPMRVSGTEVLAVPSERGMTLIFKTSKRGSEGALRRRTADLADMYNAVYGEDGRNAAWARTKEVADGAQLVFEVIAEPDSEQAAIERLRTDIRQYAARMETESGCPLMDELISLGAPRQP